MIIVVADHVTRPIALRAAPLDAERSDEERSLDPLDEFFDPVLPYQKSISAPSLNSRGGMITVGTRKFGP